ncbi:MAG: 5'-methylthioadenosine/S-adenosylhomocysteine nucleosidase [Rhodospirillales bacterium]
MIRALAAFFLLCLAALPVQAQDKMDTTPRIVVMSAFEQELVLLQSRAQIERRVTVNGVEFTLGKLAGKDVVMFLSGVSMVNAAMTTQLALDRFNVSAVVFSGIAGGVNPGLQIGDVTVAARWGQYQEMVFARQTDKGFAPPPWMVTPFPANGYMFTREVNVRRDGGKPEGEKRFWFDADARMLEVARQVASKIQLAKCTPGNACLGHAPKIVVGGNGVSGQTFVDNAQFREWTFTTFKADVLDMESAASAMVAYANNTPFIAFRSLSDLAGGGEGQNEIKTFFQLAADNAAKVLIAFLEAWH